MDRWGNLDHQIVKALTYIVLMSVGGIIGLSLAALAVDALGRESSINIGDQVASVLGQIASAGVGALAGYFTARTVQREEEQHERSPERGKEPEQE